MSFGKKKVPEVKKKPVLHTYHPPPEPEEEEEPLPEKELPPVKPDLKLFVDHLRERMQRTHIWNEQDEETWSKL